MRMVKSGKPAATDPLLADVRARTDRFIGHVRYASNPETVCAANSHPFQALGVTLAHNGTFYGKIGAEGDARKISDTVVFLELLEDRWVERSLEGLSETIRGILSDRELVGEYSAANLLIAAGDRMFAFRRYQRNGDYYTMYLKSGEGLTVVASQPLDAGPGWRGRFGRFSPMGGAFQRWRGIPLDAPGGDTPQRWRGTLLYIRLDIGMSPVRMSPDSVEAVRRGVLRDVLGDLPDGLLHETIRFLFRAVAGGGHLGRPVAPLEHEAAGPPDLAFYLRAAGRAFPERRVAHLLDLFELPAFSALVFVGRHVAPRSR